MATIIQRNSQDNLLQSTAVEATTEPVRDDLKEQRTGTHDKSTIAVRRLAELMDTWAQGSFNNAETFAQVAGDFYTKDVVIDVESANAQAGVPELREYSFDTLSQWFSFLASFELTDVVVAAVPSSKDPSQVWQQFNCVATSKATGKSAHCEVVNVIDFEGDKVKRMTAIYSDPAVIAYLNGQHETLNEVKMPIFEPHPDPMPVFEAAFAAWGSGEFAKAETKQAAFDKLVHPEFILDASNAVLPEVFKTYRGHAGSDEWANGVVGTWEFTRMEMTAEVGLKPGCVMQRMECDVTLSGKQAKGVVMYNECAYNADGKAVYNKIFLANPKVVASLYATEC